eukprot:Clim_evm64s128 gene=Clim_evmTU64s128
MKRSVRIVLVGDPKVGKSSLITSLMREQFQDDVPPVVQELTIPPEVTPERVTTYIMDTSSSPSDKETLEESIKNANVICIVYDVSRSDTFTRVSTYWLPYIRRILGNELVSIVLVGNKIDTRAENDNGDDFLEEMVLPVLNEYREVETCIECSAKTLMNISEVFYYAQKAVLHPTAPLYDAANHLLKEECRSALCRIFKLCDLDKDEALNDDELNIFQTRCFNQPLQPKELQGIRDVIQENIPEGINKSGHITVEGFVFLHKLFIQRGRLETTWTVLRKFGYGDDLRLRDDFLYPQLHASPDQPIELSPKGYQFFTDLFMAHDKDRDGALSPDELSNLFSTSPGNPWTDYTNTTVTNEKGWITLAGFLAQWAKTTLLEPETTMEYLAYLGYTGQEEAKTAIKVLRSKRVDAAKRKTARSVFQAYLFGASGSGKSSMVRALLEKPFNDKHVSTGKKQSAVNAVSVNGAERYLVLHEIPAENDQDQELIKNHEFMEQCDVVCFLYDINDPHSFEHVAKLHEQIDALGKASIFFATKKDLGPVNQDYIMQPVEYFRELGMPSPQTISVKNDETASSDIFAPIVVLAQNPRRASLQVATPESDSSFFVKLTIGLGIGIVLGYAGYRYMQQR